MFSVSIRRCSPVDLKMSSDETREPAVVLWSEQAAFLWVEGGDEQPALTGPTEAGRNP